jgi:hypothetical protein
MAVLMVLGLIRRQVVVVAVGLALTCFALVLVTRVSGVYYAQTNVRLMLQRGNWWENPIQNDSQTLISTAGLLQRTVTIGHAAQPVSDNTTLFGIGVRHGDSVRIPNTGGQWAYNFEHPVLSVEAVGSTPEEALSRMTTVLDKIDNTLVQMQNQYKIPRNQQIITSFSPRVPQVRQVSGSPVRAKAITVLLGTFLTVLGAGLFDLYRSSRRRRAEEREPEPEQPEVVAGDVEAAGVQAEPELPERPAVPRQPVRT